MLHVHIYYEVEEGDTMLDIALQFKLNMAKLMVMNEHLVSKHRDINKIFVGEWIRIQ
jgi:spore germination protein YaaH